MVKMADYAFGSDPPYELRATSYDLSWFVVHAAPMLCGRDRHSSASSFHAGASSLMGFPFRERRAAQASRAECRLRKIPALDRWQVLSAWITSGAATRRQRLSFLTEHSRPRFPGGWSACFRNGIQMCPGSMMRRSPLGKLGGGAARLLECLVCADNGLHAQRVRLSVPRQTRPGDDQLKFGVGCSGGNSPRPNFAAFCHRR
jgi:hypothetical protein